MRIVDVHTHVFPDALAARAMAHLEKQGNIRAVLDGRLASLVASMDAAGIEQSAVMTIATKPEQTAPIVAWCRQVASPRVVPFASVHPADPQALAWVDRIADAGLRGIKLHPYYQGFDLADERHFALYRAIARRGLVLLAHTGFDMAFPRDRVADAARVRRVVEAVPDLTFVASHLGGWQDWDEAERWLIGQPVYIETSVSLGPDGLPPARARDLLLRHPADRLLFGTDSPWEDQAQEVARVRALGLPGDRLAALLGGNAARLLAS